MESHQPVAGKALNQQKESTANGLQRLPFTVAVTDSARGLQALNQVRWHHNTSDRLGSKALLGCHEAARRATGNDSPIPLCVFPPSGGTDSALGPSKGTSENRAETDAQ